MARNKSKPSAKGKTLKLRRVPAAKKGPLVEANNKKKCQLILKTQPLLYSPLLVTLSRSQHPKVGANQRAKAMTVKTPPMTPQMTARPQQGLLEEKGPRKTATWT